VAHLSGLPAERRRCARHMEESGCPFVLIEEPVDAPKAASVIASNRSGAEEAVAYLHARGHKRVAFLCPDRPWPAVEERFAGYSAALKARRLPGPREWRVDTESIEASRTFMETALRRETSVSAVLCSNDVMAMGAVQAAKRVGRRVPEDLAIIGFDDFDFGQYVEPPLTTVRVPGYDMARRAAELLIDFLQHGTFAETSVTFPTTLIERGTA
jgi:DNA-binding LacI/PurR family transcriptional regulator